MEPVLTVRGYVRVLTDAGKLPEGYVASELLSHTLPPYYLEPPSLPSAGGAEEAAAAEEGGGGASAAEDTEATEILLDLTLIYSEFEECILKFAALHATGSPPWTPPPAAADESSADAGEAGDAAEEAAEPEAAEPEADAGGEGAEAADAEPETSAEQPVDGEQHAQTELRQPRNTTSTARTTTTTMPLTSARAQCTHRRCCRSHETQRPNRCCSCLFASLHPAISSAQLSP